MKTKTFDCVIMKHLGAQKINEKIAGMTLEQQLDFWQQHTQALRDRQQAIRDKRQRESAIRT